MKTPLQFKLVFGLLMLGLVSCSAARPESAVSTEGNIARLTARILDQSHYSRHRLDDEMAGKFLERYLEELDGQHLVFLQSDLEEATKALDEAAKEHKDKKEREK